VVPTIRSCLVIARNLNKKDEEKWMTSELSGYNKDFPWYRIVSCPIKTSYSETTDFEEISVWQSVHKLSATRMTEPRYITIHQKDSSKLILLQEHTIAGILNAVVDKCLFFLNDIISELQYGGVVEYLMEEI